MVNDEYAILIEPGDSAIRLFDPNHDVEAIRQNIPTAARGAVRGHMTQVTLDALRDASRPLMTKELARHVMAERGLNTADMACCGFSHGAPRRCSPGKKTRDLAISQGFTIGRV